MDSVMDEETGCRDKIEGGHPSENENGERSVPATIFIQKREKGVIEVSPVLTRPVITAVVTCCLDCGARMPK